MGRDEPVDPTLNKRLRPKLPQFFGTPETRIRFLNELQRILEAGTQRVERPFLPQVVQHRRCQPLITSGRMIIRIPEPPNMEALQSRLLLVETG